MFQKIFLRFNRKKYRLLYYKNLVIFYNKFSLEKYIYGDKILFNLGLNVYQPKRQLYTDVFYNKVKTISTGVVLKDSVITLKCYKRKMIANSAIILYLQRTYGEVLRYLYFFFLKNFTYRLWNFIEKLWVLVEPSIFIFLHNQSYNPTIKRVKRIKRRVLRMLKKQ